MMMSAPSRSHRGGITIRHWVEHDGSEVAALLSAIWRHDPPTRLLVAEHGPARDEPEAFRRTLVAETDGGIVGAATVWENPLHPARWRLSAHVDPGYRRRGIGSALFGRLLAEVASHGPRSWQSATRADDDSGQRFLAHHGFRPVMRTRLGELDPTALGESAWEELAAATVAVAEAGYRIVALPDLPDEASLRSSLAVLHAEIYRRAHGWNPPVELSEDDARRLFLGDDLIPEALFAALADDRPVGVASLRLGEAPADRELGWIGVADEHHERAAPLTAALLGRCLTRARVDGRPIRLEVDEADRHLWRLVDALPVPWEPDWLTFARPDPAIPPAGA